MARTSVFIAGLLAASLSAPAFADVLELKDGQVLNGKYVGGSAGIVKFETAEGVQAIETAKTVALTFTAPAAAAGAAAGAAAAPGSAPAPAAGAAAQPAVLAAQSTPAVAAPVTVPAGTTLLVRMMDGISSQNKPGSKFTTVLESDLSVDGAVVAKAGTKVYGVLEAAKQAGRAAGRSVLDISLKQINLEGGLATIETSDYEMKGKSSAGKTAKGALVGAGVGAAVDGGEGAGKGAAIGAGASMLKKGQTLTIPPGALLEFKLAQPFKATPPKPSQPAAAK
jgi:hypothetical protein